jgi:hypothetical protein
VTLIQARLVEVVWIIADADKKRTPAIEQIAGCRRIPQASAMTAAEHQCGDNTCASTRPAPSSSSRAISRNQRNILHFNLLPG